MGKDSCLLLSISSPFENMISCPLEDLVSWPTVQLVLAKGLWEGVICASSGISLGEKDMAFFCSL